MSEINCPGKQRFLDMLKPDTSKSKSESESESKMKLKLIGGTEFLVGNIKEVHEDFIVFEQHDTGVGPVLRYIPCSAILYASE